MGVYDLEAGEYNKKLAEALKEIEEFEVPEFMSYVKSGVSKERPPFDQDFWFKRAASILRQLYINKIVGVGKLRVRYGGRKDRGMQPPKFKRASGKIIRLILQQAEKANLIEKSKTKKAGRKLTDKGIKLLEEIK